MKFDINLISKEIIKTAEYGIENNHPLLLIGDTGVGKTSFIRYLANSRGNRLVRINLNGATGIEELLGKYLFEKGETKWIDGSLIEAMRKGEWILFDEINAATPEVLFVLHSLLDDDRQIQLKEQAGEIITPHKNFRFFASMNPSYAGTKELNKALLSRFPVVLNFEFPSMENEIKIIKIHTGFEDNDILKRIIRMAHELRFAFRAGITHCICSTRELISFCNLLKAGLSEENAFNFAVLNKCDEDERNTALSVARMFIDVPAPKEETNSLLAENQKLKRKAESLEIGATKHKELERLLDKMEGDFNKAFKDGKNADCSKIVGDLVKIMLGKKIAKSIGAIEVKNEKSDSVGFIGK